MFEAPVSPLRAPASSIRIPALMVAGLCFVFFAPILAQAQTETPTAVEVSAESEEEARIHFELAERYYRDGRFSNAADEFQVAYELSGRTELLYNAFLAHREASEFAEAAVALEGYLPVVPEGSRRRQLEVRLEQTRSLRDRATAEGEAAEVEVEVEVTPEDRGNTADVEAYEAPQESEGGSVVPWVLVGTGAAMVVAGAVTGVLALSAQSDRDALCENNLCVGDFESVQERGRTLALTTDVLLFGGVALAAGGVLWLLLDKDPPVDAVASCSADGCAATLTGSF
ncbi:MAG: hypothetical protein AB8H86_26460 [Polyangiales bacterium]